MLFLLTGDVQVGKTRWLEGLAAELAEAGVEVAGVLAPGVWREGEGRLEKLGIDNVLLPGGERVAFARRRDLALAEGAFDPASQSAAAQLAWHISDDALARVNAHFDALAEAMFHVKQTFAQTDVSRETSGAGPGLLVVDELGRLELERDGGLASATALLAAGPTERFPHALAVVRDWLCPRARERFGAAWGGAEELAPGEEARTRVREALGLPV
ncbi:P-loop NTPase family protein [Arabiibacter massiliensis]|uniref:nucleoside-triphosphatase n=1 Tax=Arabiibacter massiliensis TaxID=1870985 RepID=UPI0009BA52EB|nr:nucleoside-triphosphatase [Arabiibacter massiliensis]